MPDEKSNDSSLANEKGLILVNDGEHSGVAANERIGIGFNNRDISSIEEGQNLSENVKSSINVDTNREIGKI